MVVKMISILMALGGLLVFFLLFSLMALSLARHNLFFTLVEEGKIKVILHNKVFKKAIMRYMGFHLDKNQNVVQNLRREKLTFEEARQKGYKWDGAKRRKEDKRWYGYWLLFCKFYKSLMGGGLAFVGLWPFYTVHTYQFRWWSLKDGKPTEHDELLDYVYAKSESYWAELKASQTAGMIPLNVELVLTIRVVNPYKSLFRTHQWLEFAISRLDPYIRQYIPYSELKFEDLIKVKQGPDSPLFVFLGTSKVKLTSEEKQLLRNEGRSEREIEAKEMADKGILWILWEVFGVDIQSIEFRSITTTDKEYEKAYTQKALAEQEKAKTIIQAEGQAQAMNTITEAKKKGIEEVSSAIEKHGEVGLAYKMMETIEESSQKPGNWILSIDSLFHMMKRAFGNFGNRQDGRQERRGQR
jgi:regulator of protease activity HflC (stomatin/prohibitin superfamily)